MERRNPRPGADSFTVPSDSNRDFGLFLMFTGVVASVPAYYLYRVLVLHTAVWDWRKGAALGLILALVGLCLILFTRRAFRVREGAVEVRDGLVRRPIRYHWKGQPLIRLQSIEQDRGGRVLECWQVMLVDGKYEYLLDSRPNQHQESRSLAEFLAKSIGCPMAVRQDVGQALQIQASDLDLAFGDRVQRYPSLLGPRPERPEGCPIREEVQGSQRVFRWGMRTSGLFSETVGLFLLALAASVVPLPGERDLDYSLFELARLHHDYAYFQVVGGLFALALFLQFGYRVCIVLTPEAVQTQTCLWGLTLWSRSIPVRVLEEISVRGRSQGAFLQLVSDERIVNLRILRQDLAHYLAAELRYAVAGASTAPAGKAG